jgi:hypothetical protein
VKLALLVDVGGDGKGEERYESHDGTDKDVSVKRWCLMQEDSCKIRGSALHDSFHAQQQKTLANNVSAMTWSDHDTLQWSFGAEAL